MTANVSTVQSSSHDRDGKRRSGATSQNVDLAIVTAESLASSKTLVRDIAPTFIDWQCRMIAGVMRGVIFLAEPGGSIGDECARWPETGQHSDALKNIATSVLNSNKSQLLPQVRYSQHKGQVCDVLACPITHNGRAVAVISVALATRALPQQKAVLQLIEWGVNWFQTLIGRESKNIAQRAPVLLELMSDGIARSKLDEFSQAAVELLQKRTPCDRASIAIVSGSRLKLTAVSGLSQFDSRTRFASRIEDAMEEADDQGEAIEYPASSDDSSLIRRAHQRLHDANPNSCFFTVVAQHGSTRLGLLLEKHNKQPFDEGQKTLYQDAATLLTRTADLNRSANGSIRALFRRVRRSIVRKSKTKWTVWALIALAGVIATAFIPAPHQISADAELVSLEQQAITASINGYIDAVNVRVGDDVQPGDVLAQLDTRDLRLEADKWRGLLGAREAEYRDALASRDRIQISILRARLDQIQAELALVEAQIERAVLKAPYLGVVISGDLNQVLDAPIEKGQVLFEIAPLTDYRVVIQVSEYDIAEVNEGYHGKLRLTSLPGQLVPFTVERILPVAASGEGRTYFQVEARLTEHPKELRPGMRGVAKIIADEHSLLWNWTHDIRARLKLFFWSLGF